MVKLITTDSYFNIFPALNSCLNGKANTLIGKNLIFCEEKISLMAERFILSEYGGTFNTAVYSFGNYLRLKKPDLSALSKEGSAMAVKRVLSSVSLGCFKASRAGLAPSLYDLIIQLKSAKVSPQDLLMASEYATGALKNKLSDIYAVYDGYENFVKSENLDDQSSMLDYLPSVIENDAQIENADIYIVGFNGWTNQIRQAIATLITKAKSVTAILTEGDNELVYVNETAQSFRDLVKACGQTLIEQNMVSEWAEEGKIIADNLFNPSAVNRNKKQTDKIFCLTAENKAQEVERVAEIIRAKVVSGQYRYRDFTVAIADVNAYSDDIERAFNMLDLPYFVDQKKKVSAHPLVKLILSYFEATRTNLEKKTLSAFYKNPLFCKDKNLSDEFENYVLAYNIDYSRIKKPFTFQPKGRLDLDKLNEFRQSVVDCFDEFDVRKLLTRLNVSQSLEEYSVILKELGEAEECAINEQIFSAVDRILTEIQAMLGGVQLSLIELRNIFISGVSAMELSIIPQYNDAVFVGGLKETALAKAKYLFVLGLTSDVPAVRDDVALLSDGDITQLEDIKILVEPKIKVVNHRARENAGLALSAFSEGLYLSYPLQGISGDKTVKSEMMTCVENLFTVKPFPKRNRYSTYKQGLTAFARDTGRFVTGKIDDFTVASSFFKAVGEDSLKPLLDRANKEVKLRLENSREIMAKKYVSPTRIEEYYSCPYKTFLSKGLKLKSREEGVVDGLSVGNIIHEIFSKYMLRLSRVKDKQSSDELVSELASEILKKQDYARFLDDAVTRYSVARAIDECAKFCYKNYLAMSSSSFTVKRTEAGFGDGKDCAYPAIGLLDGQVKLSGVIDRVDESGEYYRVLDYKTGSPKSDLDLLFTGQKLQLYLYAKAVNPNKDKKLAGAYYMPISDEFRSEDKDAPVLSKGVTLFEEGALVLQDNQILQSKKSEFLPVSVKKDQMTIDGEMTAEGLQSAVDYAVAVSEKAVERMSEGVIVATPANDKVCGYCEFKALCPLNNPVARAHDKVDATTIIDSIKGEKE